VNVLLFKEYRFTLDTRSALHVQLLGIQRDIQKKLEGWDVNIPFPLVNEVARDTVMEGKTWKSKIKGVLTLVLRAPVISTDFLSSWVGASSGALFPEGPKLG